MFKVIPTMLLTMALTACAYTPESVKPNMGFTTNGTTTLTYKEFSDPEFGVGCGEAPHTRTSCTYDSRREAREDEDEDEDEDTTV